MIPFEPEYRRKLAEALAMELAGSWYNVPAEKAWDVCVHEPQVAKFRDMAALVLRTIDRFEPGKMPEPKRNDDVFIPTGDIAAEFERVVSPESNPGRGDTPSLFG